MKSTYIILLAAVVTAVTGACTNVVPEVYDKGVSVDVAALSFRYEGGEQILKVTSNNPWTMDMGGCNWITASQTSGESTEKVILSCGQNPDPEQSREATITVTSGSSHREVTITQDRMKTWIEITDADGADCNGATFEASAFMLITPKETVKLKIKSNGTWSASLPAGISAEPAEGGTAGSQTETEVTLTIDNTNVTSDGTSAVTFICSDEEVAYNIKQTCSYSNCYVVAGPGEYSIPAGKPDGTLVADASAASWLYETEQGLISGTEPSYSAGKVTFTVNESAAEDRLKGGYGIIVLTNGADEIVWSYLIWYTKEIKDIRIGDNKWLDRNIGAWTDNLPVADFNGRLDQSSFGCYYQWGRKDPFPGIPDYRSGSINGFAGLWFTPVYTPIPALDRGTFGNSGKQAYNQILGNTVATVTLDAKSASYSTTAEYIGHMTKNPHLWYNRNGAFPGPDGANVWGNPQRADILGVKTIYDPCPPGYKVMSEAAWMTLTENLAPETLSVPDPGRGILLDETLYFPIKGYEAFRNTDASPSGGTSLGSGGGSSGLWSDGSNGGHYCFFQATSKTYIMTYCEDRAGINAFKGCGVRCIKESYSGVNTGTEGDDDLINLGKEEWN